MLPINIQEELVAQLRLDKSITCALLFGSYAKGAPNEDSDVDIAIIIDRAGMHRSYSDILEDRKRINALLMHIRKKIPMDIVIYTNEEWEHVREDPSDFIRNIEQEAVNLL